MYRPGIDVVVVNYQTPSDLHGFCQSFEDFEPIHDYSLTIVNNEPTEADVCVTDSWMDSGLNIRHLNNKENVGFARAVNTGVAIGNRECIAIFNADIVLSEHSIDSCYVNLMDREDWGVLGPRQVNERGAMTAAGIFGTLKDPKHRGWMNADSEKFQDIRDDATTVSGSAYFIKRAVWDELTTCGIYRYHHPDAEGAFLPTPHYYEETWCSYHAQAHGYKCVYFGLVKVVHKWHQASPLGVPERLHLPKSQQMFRDMCDAHNIERD